jgi:hypothetical protein
MWAVLKVVTGEKVLGCLLDIVFLIWCIVYLIGVFRYKKRNQKVKLVTNAGFQKSGLSKEEETRLCICSYNRGKIVGVSCCKAFRSKRKVK